MAIEPFRNLESADAGDTRVLTDILDALRYNDQGLIPAIAQDFESLEVLMLGWMNRTSIERTLSRGLCLLLVPEPTDLLAQRRIFWASAGAESHALRLRRRHGSAAGRPVRSCLSYQPQQLLLPRE